MNEIWNEIIKTVRTIKNFHSIRFGERSENRVGRCQIDVFDSGTKLPEFFTQQRHTRGKFYDLLVETLADFSKKANYSQCSPLASAYSWVAYRHVRFRDLSYPKRIEYRVSM